MRSITTSILVLLCFLLTGCKEKEAAREEPKTIEEVDLTTNDVVHMTDADGNYASLQDVIKNNKGKVIYMDIWASWCGPCKAMMPASHKLQEKFKNEDVVFLYVSIDRNENAWKQSAEKFGLTGYNYIAKNYPKAKLFQTNNVSTIPRYMLFDKNGRLVDSNAQRPNSRLLEENIRAFLRV